MNGNFHLHTSYPGDKLLMGLLVFEQCNVLSQGLISVTFSGHDEPYGLKSRRSREYKYPPADNVPEYQTSEALNVELWKPLCLMPCGRQLMMFVSCKSIGNVPQFCQFSKQDVTQSTPTGRCAVPLGSPRTGQANTLGDAYLHCNAHVANATH